MIVGKPPDIPSSEITLEGVYLNRRTFIAAAGGAALLSVSGVARPTMLASSPTDDRRAGPVDRDGGEDKLTPYEDITTYNNFYEFGTDKGDPAENAHTLRPRPWSVAVTAW